ncbi:hypothetical protein ABB37_06767 [Leptomonas pyrrhocoris]|uniref:CSC1/OSCA1-like 7TM region domain-containing protein n=1 Tax=Leptomonas pyrrhocoris TaxID=157538 RepID=A0A0M9FXA6_LEPPY|nr:hypothetical protein ABB37_06767 [Leptomonas pyrrhocoris]KPA78010.1 hypothetical protein ABB37_06767 [Leptomonas pyrrhocoris]|eukprot:XP_015656449.1 hypothetical protein ABB37_06767 [Leptomonas pyrrhocoris]
MSEGNLPASSHYDDQGLFVSLIVGAALLVGFGGFMAFLHCTNILWLKRFYRPNHTVEPAPLASTTTTSASETRRNSAARPPPPLPSASVSQTIFAEHTVRPNGRSGRAFTRRKRLGVSLPFTSTFFICPRLRDWISIEEPSLRDRKDGALSPVHYAEPAAPLRYTSDRSFMPIRPACSPVAAASPDGAAPFLAPYPAVDVRADAAELVEVTPAAHFPRSGPSTPSYGAIEPSSPRPAPQQPSRSSPAASSRVSQPGEPLPKTPTDPLVAIYLFTLKFFLALMFFGELFTVWIMPLASSDNYVEQTMRQRDIHGCGRQNDNETGCNALKPYCRFHGIALGCAVVPLHGIYDLTVSNIRPRSWRWTRVGLLNLGFCAVLVLLTLVYLRKVGQYVEAVMANQMRYALGYRVACIRGLDTTDIRSENALRKNFLELSVYFPSAPPSPATSSTTAAPNAAARQQRSRNAYVTNDSIFDDYNPANDSYTICECLGLNCLFSTAGMHYYVVRREDATFTEPGKVEQILITREPPFGLLETIANTESAMAHLQEAIADEKALQRKTRLHSAELRVGAAGAGTLRRRRHHSPRGRQLESAPLQATSVVVSGSAVPSSNENSGTAVAVRGNAVRRDEAVLMTRCRFPACCDEMPAVPYYESVFFKNAADLNYALERVPHQPVSGAAFVIFKDSLSAFEFIQLFTARFGGLVSSLSATIAGPPGRIFQSSLTASRCALYLRFFFIFWVYIGLILTWSIPISFLGSLESLSQLPGIGEFLTYFTSLSTTLQSLVNAYLPVVVLALFNVALPYIIRVLVRMMGAFNRIECDGGQLYLQYIFMVMTAVIAQAAFQGAMSRLTDLLFDPNEEAFINFIVACVTPSNGYFYAKIISATCLSTWMDLLDPICILKALLLRGSARIQRNYDALFLPCEFEFPRLLSFDLMILSMGLLFHMTAPLLGLLTVVYFFVRYWSQRAKQTDRYRPTLSPAQDCTDFGVPAQVIRCVMWLYCFAETGGVLLMGLRDNSSGVVLCSVSLGTGLVLTVYVYVKTRRWSASLACARHFAATPHPHHHTHPISYQKRQQQQQQQSPGLAPTVTTPLRGRTSRFDPPSVPAPLSSSARSAPPTGTGGTAPAATATAGTSQSNASWADTPFENNPEDNPEERQLGRASRQYLVQEEGAMEGYEHVTLNQVLFDSARNPFLSHLLPRKAGVSLRFQPKHQRLSPIDAAREVRIMHETNFVVERYWDRGMTWFEEDMADRSWNGDDARGESSGWDSEEDSADGEERDRPRGSRGDVRVVNAPGAGSSGEHQSSPSFAQLARNESGSGTDAGAMKPCIAAVVDATLQSQTTVTDRFAAAASTPPQESPTRAERQSATPSEASPTTPLPPPPSSSSLPSPLRCAEEQRVDTVVEDEPQQRSVASAAVRTGDVPVEDVRASDSHVDPAV